MPSLVVPAAAQVRLMWTFNSAQGFNVLGARVAGGFSNTQTLANTLGSAIMGHFTSSGLAALMATTTALVGVGVRDIRTANLPEYISTASAVPGTGSGNPLPNEIAAVVTLRTALAGRSFRGRAYFSGAIVSQSDSVGHIVTGFNTALLAFMADVQADMLANGLTPAIISRRRLEVHDITATVIRDVQWDSQRRRQR